MGVSSLTGYNNPAGNTLIKGKATEKSTAEQSSESKALNPKNPYQKINAGRSGTNVLSGNVMASLNRVVSEINKVHKGPITSKVLQEYRDVLEQNYIAELKAELLKVGVDKDTHFKLLATVNGELEVICTDKEQKAKIEEYFSKNDKMKQKFIDLQAVSNLERMQAAEGTARNFNAMRTIKAELQANSMNIFMEAISNSGIGYSPLLGNFGDSSTLSLGANFLV